MEEAEVPIEVRAMEALGSGFDLASDFKLKFAKGRVVALDESNKRDIVIPDGSGGVTIRGVSENIRCDKGDRMRFKSDVLELNQMSELLNKKSSIREKVPSGYLNAIFDLSGSWLIDAADAKNLAFDGFFIALYYLHLTASPLVLQDTVKKSVPSHWNPASLSRCVPADHLQRRSRNSIVRRDRLTQCKGKKRKGSLILKIIGTMKLI